MNELTPNEDQFPPSDRQIESVESGSFFLLLAAAALQVFLEHGVKDCQERTLFRVWHRPGRFLQVRPPRPCCFVVCLRHSVFAPSLSRKNTDIRARDLQLVGWVRNLPDGRVECVAEGPKEQLDALHEWMKVGPKHARVSGVEVQWSDATGEFTSFSVRQ